METKENAYAVLELCLADPDYNHDDLDNDICGHIANHMGYASHKLPDGSFPWSRYYNHIGFAEYEWPLWQLLNMDVTKDFALKKFAEMILFIHGPHEKTGVPKNLCLL